MTRRFEHRLLLFVLPVVVTALVAVAALAWYGTKQRLIAESQNALAVTGRNLEAWIDGREERLRDASAVLSRDFGFRSAVATGDPATTRSALDNLRRRIAATRLTLIDLDRKVLVDTGDATQFGGPLPVPDAMDLTDSQGAPSSFAQIGGRVYQLTMVPVLAPDPIAWIVAALEVTADDLRAFRLQSTLPVDVTFAEPGAAQASSATTLVKAGRDEAASLLRMQLAESDADFHPRTTVAGDHTWVTLHRRLPGVTPDTPVVGLVQYSIDAALKPYGNLAGFILAVGTVAVLGTLLSISFIARTMTAPIRVLDEAAHRISAGDYSTRVRMAQGDELGRLGATFNAMVDAVASREQQILHQSLHDPVTGLPNLACFGQRIEARIAAEDPASHRFSIFLVEIEHLQEIRNTLGHELTDRVLVSVGARIAGACKNSDLVARIASGTFGVLADGAGPGHLDSIGTRIVGALADPVAVGGVNADVMIRVGVASYPEHGTVSNELLRHAEVAATLGSSSSRFATYDKTRDPYRPELLSRMGELKAGIQRNELELYVQPKLCLESRTCNEVEALIRWRHPELGLLPPSEFIPLAERTGVIQEITRWAVAEAIRQARRWHDRGDEVGIAVNLSARDLRDPALPAYVRSHLEQAGLPAERLTLEITESSVMEKPDEALGILAELRKLGVGLAIDDFGTGYSSLAYLKRLPVTELKIDRSFVTDVTTSAQDELIVRTTIGLGRELGLELVAEGVEDAATLATLERLGCDTIQGYYISPPISVSQFDVFLQASEWSSRGRGRTSNLRILNPHAV